MAEWHQGRIRSLASRWYDDKKQRKIQRWHQLRTAWQYCLCVSPCNFMMGALKSRVRPYLEIPQLHGNELVLRKRAVHVLSWLFILQVWLLVHSILLHCKCHILKIPKLSLMPCPCHTCLASVPATVLWARDDGRETFLLDAPVHKTKNLLLLWVRIINSKLET